jgi:hypothetical protein
MNFSYSIRCGHTYIALDQEHYAWPRPPEAQLATRRHPERFRTIGELLPGAVDGMNEARREAVKRVDDIVRREIAALYYPGRMF